MSDPLLEALEALREIDADYVAAHPDTVDDEVAERMRTLRLVVTAINELGQRDEPAEPDLVRAEMANLSDEFVFHSPLLLDFAAGFESDGDYVNASTLRNAHAWMRRRIFAGQNID